MYVERLGGPQTCGGSAPNILESVLLDITAEVSPINSFLRHKKQILFFPTIINLLFIGMLFGMYVQYFAFSAVIFALNLEIVKRVYLG